MPPERPPPTVASCPGYSRPTGFNGLVGARFQVGPPLRPRRNNDDPSRPLACPTNGRRASNREVGDWLLVGPPEGQATTTPADRPIALTQRGRHRSTRGGRPIFQSGGAASTAQATDDPADRHPQSRQSAGRLNVTRSAMSADFHNSAILEKSN